MTREGLLGREAKVAVPAVEGLRLHQAAAGAPAQVAVGPALRTDVIVHVAVGVAVAVVVEAATDTALGHEKIRPGNVGATTMTTVEVTTVEALLVALALVDVETEAVETAV